MVTASVTDWEQWAVAHHYVKKHGADAPILAAMRADELLEKGEFTGSKVYVAIVRKIEALLTPPEGALH